jgi:(p)ppGpp synthase/HD superfamily hydrolase
LRETALVLLREKKDVSFDEIIIALLHDIIEDTDMDFKSIKFLFGEKIALAVFLISKKSPLDYIPENDEKNYEKKEELQKSWLLNGNNKVKTRYLKIYKEIKKIEKKLPQDWEKLIDEFKKLYDNKTYKGKRNDDYFSHMKSLDKFKEYTKKTAEELWLTLRDYEIEEIIKISLSAKFADRLHNLRTEEVKKDFSEKNIKKARRKIDETKDIFYKISEEFDEKYGTNFNKKIKKEVLKLEQFIIKQNFNNIQWLYLVNL